MILLVTAAIFAMGGIVAYLAHEKGRNALLWGIYGILAAPVALPHVLMVHTRDEEDESDVWAEIRHTLQTQSVNDRPDKMPESGTAKAAAIRRDPSIYAETHDSFKPDSLTQYLERQNQAQKQTGPQPHKQESQKADMFADKNNPRTPATRAEPSFGAAAAPTGQKTGANDFRLDASDRIGASFTAAPSSHAGDTRSRAPLSADPDAQRAGKTSFGGPLIATGAGLAAVVVALVVLAPTLRAYIPAGMPFSTADQIKDVADTSAPNAVPGMTPVSPTAMAPSPASGSAKAPVASIQNSGSAFGPASTSTQAQDVGDVKLGAPIKSDTKAAPAYTPSTDKPVDLGALTRNMKAAEISKDDQAKLEAKSEPVTPPAKAAKSEAKTAAVVAPAPAAAPKLVAPKAETKSAAVVAPVPAAAPKAAPKPSDDFFSMMNKAIAPGSAPGGAPAAAATQASTGSESEQVSTPNDLVQSVQQKLRDRGYDPGTMDGRTNAKTVQAIRDFQQNNAMTPDGLIDVALMEKLGVVGKRLQFPSN